MHFINVYKTLPLFSRGRVCVCEREGRGRASTHAKAIKDTEYTNISTFYYGA